MVYCSVFHPWATSFSVADKLSATALHLLLSIVASVSPNSYLRRVGLAGRLEQPPHQRWKNTMPLFPHPTQYECACPQIIESYHFVTLISPLSAYLLDLLVAKTFVSHDFVLFYSAFNLLKLDSGKKLINWIYSPWLLTPSIGTLFLCAVRVHPIGTSIGVVILRYPDTRSLGRSAFVGLLRPIDNTSRSGHAHLSPD